ncbi:hypothetical protein [Rhodoplanes sp. SY1]|uniref:hypothetical protein n=1 Tax=Rhodoplanes sp. SY1 TaxID=3166646 RepID=UPI0038B4D2A1
MPGRNPEFLCEGAAVRDFEHLDCIIVGTTDERLQGDDQLYRQRHLTRAPLMFTARGTAELIKYAANAFQATEITFINAPADLCEQVGGDVQEVARSIGLDNRSARSSCMRGPGYDGSCFRKGTLALIKTA